MNVPVIAEVASAHEGRWPVLVKMIEAAHEAGCAFVKFQIFRARELVAPDHPRFDFYRKIEFSDAQWIEAAAVCASLGLPVIIDVFDVPSLEIARQMNVSGYKLHSSSASDRMLLKEVARDGKCVYLSAGGSRRDEIQKSIDCLHEGGTQSIVLMHGYQNFPTALKNINLRKIQALREAFGLPVGLQDHVDGESPMALSVPLMAAALGCAVVEKHFTLDRSLKETDYYSSLNPPELKRLVEMLQQADEAMGSDTFELSEDELKYRHLMKKSLYAGRRIRKGESLAPEQLVFRRSLMDDRILADQWDHAIGSRAVADIEPETRLTWAMLEKPSGRH
ncbi:MAG: N-acetylneuraminate synthase family protein [Lentisphaerae bacterium]|nr:N-acetylneuraminate synthase family protein [Lentisphaerota bacterium]